MEHPNLILGYMIKKLRKLYSISGKKFSEELYISQSTLSKIENYSQIPNSNLFMEAIKPEKS